MVDQLCQAYHWSFKDAMSLTMPQIIMMNHAAWCNGKRFDKDGKKQEDIVWNGKRLEELTTEEMIAYQSDWG